MSKAKFQPRNLDTDGVKAMLKAAYTVGESADELLRRNGYRIWSRPKRGEPVWKRSGRLYPQSVALKRIEEASECTPSK